MKFGKVMHPETIDFTMPQDHPDTKSTLMAYKDDKEFEVYVGCPKWNRQDLIGFYPRGTKDELTYYSRQFNSVELNATFYRFFPPEQFIKWAEKVPSGFKFFPKIAQHISHFRRLINVEIMVDDYLYAVSNLKENLGTIFLQFHNNFSPKNFDRVVTFAESWPSDIPLAMEFRHTDWFTNTTIASELYQLLEANSITNIIVDTAGRRDLMHMRLTNNEAFIRFVAANHTSDYSRLDAWVDKLRIWKDAGLQKVHFFVHQHIENASPLLSAYIIERLNNELYTNLTIPVMDNEQAANY